MQLLTPLFFNSSTKNIRLFNRPHATLGSGLLSPKFAGDDAFASSASVIPPASIDLKRHEMPVLSPGQCTPHEKYGTFNPSLTRAEDGGFHVLYRRFGERGIYAVFRRWLRSVSPQIKKHLSKTPRLNSVGYAHSPDGTTLARKRPFIVPQGDLLKEFPNGFEDPRISKIDDTYFITVTGMDIEKVHQGQKLPGNPDIEGANICLYTAKDLNGHPTYHGRLGPDTYLRNTFFHPEKVKVDGKSYYMLYIRRFPDIQHVLIEDPFELTTNKESRMRFWENALDAEQLQRTRIMTPRPGEKQIGGASAPLKTDKGWLFIYFSATETKGKRSYQAEVALTDLEKPWIVKSRSPIPFFKATDEERTQYGTDIVFPSGATIRGDRVLVHYGAGDLEMRALTCSLPKLLDYLLQFDRNGNKLRKVDGDIELA